MFKEITMCQDLLENQFPKCQNVVDSVKKSFKDNSKLEVLNRFKFNDILLILFN